jgi:hypothetical protein
MRSLPTLSMSLMLVALSGCASGGYGLVESARVPVGDVYSVEPQGEWTVEKAGHLEVWTVDGFRLEAVRFYKAIGNDEALAPKPAQGEDRRPRFKQTMTESEIAELVIDSLFSGRLTPRNLRPWMFGSAPGFRFEVDYVQTPLGVQRQALIAGAVVKNKLELIVYDAVSLHYFAAYKDRVERLLASIQIR